MRIKVLILCIFVFNSSLCLLAQNKDDRFHRYGGNNSMQFNIFGGPLVAFSNVEGSFSADLGASVGIMLTNTIFIGLYGQKLMTKPERTDLAIIGYPTYTDGQIKMYHAGGVLGYIHKPEKKIHFGAGGSAGLGLIELYAKNPSTLTTEFLYDDRVIVVIPKLFAEFNMTKWFRINISGGYRYVGKINGMYITSSDEEIPTFYQSDYSKPEFSVSLLFGSNGSYSGLLD